MEKLSFYSSIFVLSILFVDSEILHFDRIYDSKCADYGNDCNPYSEQPCCNQNHECKSSDFYEKSFICTAGVQLEESCEADEDCNRYILRSECSKHKECTCKSNTMQTSKVSCSPLLGGFCADTEKCGPDNSICSDNLCGCDDGYLPHNKFECVPALLGTHCQYYGDCEDVKYAKCSAENVCICAENTIEINPARCIIDPNNFECELDSQCEENALCVLRRCRCKPGWRLGPNHECVTVSIGKRCENDEYCSSIIKYSICSSQKKCECDQFHYPINKSFCASKINDACKNSGVCKKDIIFCIDGECHCQPNYVYDGSDCVLV